MKKPRKQSDENREAPLTRALRENDTAYFTRSADRENARRTASAPLLAHAGLVPMVSTDEAREKLRRHDEAFTATIQALNERQFADMWAAIATMSRCEELGADMTELKRRLDWRPWGHKNEAASAWLARLEAGLPAVEPHSFPKPHPCFGWLLKIDQHLPPEGRIAFDRGDMKALGAIRDELWAAHKASGCNGRCQAPAEINKNADLLIVA